ncbi:MAG: hypothetical protein WA118_11230 [Carboxydocellales bacterium]
MKLATHKIKVDTLITTLLITTLLMSLMMLWLYFQQTSPLDMVKTNC